MGNPQLYSQISKLYYDKVTNVTNLTGELQTQKGAPLLKMWEVELNECERAFIRHSHARFEITLVNGGYGEYTTEKNRYPMEPGDIFVFSSNEVHCITKADKGGLRITNLHFEPRYLGEEFSQNYGDSSLAFCLFHDPGFSNRIPSDRASALREYHIKIKEEFERGDDSYSLAIHSYLNLMLIELLRRHGYRSPAVPKSALPDLLKIYDYIESHLEEKMTLKEIAAVAGISPNYFSRRFKEFNGISLWDYITAKRIEKASKLILSGDNDLTILQIALSCGFNNTVNFNKAFKKQKGFTPRELKKDPKLIFH